MKQTTLIIAFIAVLTLGLALYNIKKYQKIDVVNSQNPIIATIAEASGISYCKNSDTLMVVSDEGAFYEINYRGDILATYKLGDYDLEGVICEDNTVMLAVEGEGLLQVNRDTLDRKFFKLKGSGFKITKKRGIEGLTKIKNRYYLSIQAKNRDDSKLLVVRLDGDNAVVEKVINHGIIDSSGLTYENKKLYIVSDTNDTLYIYDIEQKVVEKEIELPKFAQEGVAFGKRGYIFFADDNGTVLRYSLEDFGL